MQSLRLVSLSYKAPMKTTSCDLSLSPNYFIRDKERFKTPRTDDLTAAHGLTAAFSECDRSSTKLGAKRNPVGAESRPLEPSANQWKLQHC